MAFASVLPLSIHTPTVCSSPSSLSKYVNRLQPRSKSPSVVCCRAFENDHRYPGKHLLPLSHQLLNFCKRRIHSSNRIGQVIRFWDEWVLLLLLLWWSRREEMANGDFHSFGNCCSQLQQLWNACPSRSKQVRGRYSWRIWHWLGRSIRFCWS